MFPHHEVAGLGKRDELLIPGSTHVETNWQHFLQSSHDQRGLDGVELTTSLLVFPLLVLSPRLKG